MNEDAQNWFTERVGDYFSISYKVEHHLHHSRSKYQTIDVYQTARHGKLLALDGCIMLTERDEFHYHEMLVHVPMLSHPNPKNILVVGGGDGGTVREILQHETIEKVDMVEIDEDVVKISRQFFPGLSCKLDDTKVNLFFQDAVEFVKGIEAEYDVILVDSTDPIGPGEVLFTKDFYCDIYRALKPDGILAVQSESPFSLENEIGLVYQRLRSVFPLAAIYWAPVPCYPHGTWSFTFCSRNGQKAEIRRPEAATTIEADTKYYNRNIHQAAFVLPNFIKSLSSQED